MHRRDRREGPPFGSHHSTWCEVAQHGPAICVSWPPRYGRLKPTSSAPHASNAHRYAAPMLRMNAGSMLGTPTSLRSSAPSLDGELAVGVTSIRQRHHCGRRSAGCRSRQTAPSGRAVWFIVSWIDSTSRLVADAHSATVTCCGWAPTR